jgi:hypothetical protein
MNNIAVTISWEWALGIFGFLILLAWKSGSRFTALEVSMEWVKSAITDLKVHADNRLTKGQAFIAQSPICLTPMGEAWLKESGLKAYIDARIAALLACCVGVRDTNPYEVQQFVFSLFADQQLDATFEDTLEKFAFERGTTMAVLRRVGAIYFRDICLAKFNMKTQEGGTPAVAI